MACDPNTLLNGARCFDCLTEEQRAIIILSLLCQIASSSESPEDTLQSGLAAYLKLDGPVANVWADSSPNGNNFSGSDVPLPVATVGKFGFAALFSPTGQLTKQIGDFDFTGGAFEVSAWAWQNDTTVDGAVCEAGEGWSIGFTAGVGYHFALQDNVATIAVAQSLFLPDPNTWTHVRGFWQPGVGITIVVNNVAVFEPTVLLPQFIGSTTRVGLGFLAYQYGRIDEIGFWQRLLTDEERAWLWNGGNGNVLYGAPPSSGHNPPISPLFVETFEISPGYDLTGWTEVDSGGANNIIDPDYTGVVLDGLQSLRISDGDLSLTYIQRSLDPIGHFFVFFELEIISIAVPEVFSIFAAILSSTFPGLTVSVDANTMQFIVDITGASVTVTEPISVGVKYNCWIEYNKNNGANRFASFAFSTGTTRPTSGNNYADISGAISALDVVSLKLGLSEAEFLGVKDYVMDYVIASATQIGDNP